jgi:hypothetical protein
MNIFTFQEPYEGEACVGLFTYTPVDGQTEQREWIMAPLLEPLVPGQTYYCSFRANAGFGGNEIYPLVYVASNHIGLQFTTYERHWTDWDPEPAPFNHAHIQYDQVLTDTTAWTLVSGSFVADSAYTYLMIGNFFSNAQTDTVRFVDSASVEIWYDFSYTLIDEVCVSPLPGGCDLDHGVGEAAGQVPYVYPNPANEELWIGHAASNEAAVRDMLGRTVWRGQVVGDRYALDVTDWARGAYVLQLNGTGRREVVKFVLVE